MTSSAKSGSPSPPSSLVVVVNDEDIAAWLPVNNVFTGRDPWNSLKDYWSGVAFQFGRFKEQKDGSQGVPTHQITLQSTEGNSKIIDLSAQKDSTWVNVVTTIPESDGAPRNPPVDTASWKDFKKLFTESLLAWHEPHKPRAGMTIWQGWDTPTYSMEARPIGGINIHNRYTFTFQAGKGYEVTVKQGATTEVLHDVHRIELAGDPGGGHGDHNNPPERP